MCCKVDCFTKNVWQILYSSAESRQPEYTAKPCVPQSCCVSWPLFVGPDGPCFCCGMKRHASAHTCGKTKASCVTLNLIPFHKLQIHTPQPLFSPPPMAQSSLFLPLCARAVWTLTVACPPPTPPQKFRCTDHMSTIPKPGLSHTSTMPLQGIGRASHNLLKVVW